MSRKNDEKLSENTTETNLDMLAEIISRSADRRRRKTIASIVFAAVLAVSIGIFIGPRIKNLLDSFAPPPPVTVLNELTDEEKADVLKNKTIEITDTVIGESRQRRELLVLERDVQVESVWESAWGGFDVFRKTKKIISYGTGYYNLDLGGIDESCIIVDHNKKLVTIAVPHAVLKSISIDEGKTQYEDTQKGLLSFGELKLTMEQQGLLKESVEQSMREELERPEALTEADSAGRIMVSEVYSPLINVVSDGYRVIVEIARNNT